MKLDDVLKDANVTESEIFQFLDELRDSGVTNMYGAGPYITANFGLNRVWARDVLKKWMEDPRHETM